MGNAVEARALLVIRPDDIPWRVLGVRGLQHSVPCAGVVVPSFARRQIHWTELPLAHRILYTGLEPAFLLFVAHLEPVLDEDDSASRDVPFHDRSIFEEAFILFLGAKAHDMFDPGTVVPTAVEDDDFPGSREVRHIPLHVHLGLLAVGRRGECHEAEHSRTDAFRDGADGATLPGAIAALE